MAYLQAFKRYFLKSGTEIYIKVWLDQVYVVPILPLSRAKNDIKSGIL